MDEKDLELENQNLDSANEPEVNPEASAQGEEATSVAYEENDNWQFEAEAHTLNESVVENDMFEIHIPDASGTDSSQYETAQRPTKPKKAEQAEAAVKKNGIKGDKLKFVFLAVVLACVIAVLGVLGSFYYTKPNTDERMNPGNVALVVNDTPVSIGMYNYYYSCISQNYISYAQYGYYDLDPSKDFSKQKTTNNDGEEVTWLELFEEETIDQIRYITTYYEKAVADGVTLTKAQKENIQSSLDGIKDTAASNNVSVDRYISDTYGDYCGYATIKKMLEQCYIAENYYQRLSVTKKYTDEEIEKFFNENKTDYENVTFAYLQVPYEDNNAQATFEKCNYYVNQITSEDDMKKLIPTLCKSLIESYVEQGYATDFDTCAQLLSANIEVSISTKETGFLDEAINWLFDEETKVGNVKAFDDSENKVVYILYKVSEPQPDKEEVYSVRQILIMPDGVDTSTSDVKLTDEQLKQARQEAQKILDKYNDGAKTEAEFAKLAEKYSKDTESTSSGSSGNYGGLYAGVQQGTMVQSFNDWSMDSSRKYGDTGIVDSKYGCHIMFFVNRQPKYIYDCETDLRDKDEKDFTKSSKVKLHKGAMKKTKVATPQASTDGE